MDKLRRVIATITAMAVAGVVVGLPQPASVDKSSRLPYPCQHHACGCVDAEMCRTSCGCFKPQVKSCCAARVTRAQPNERDRSAEGLVLRSTSCSGVRYLVVSLAIPLIGPDPCWGLPQVDRRGHAPHRGVAIPTSRSVRPALPPPRA